MQPALKLLYSAVVLCNIRTTHMYVCNDLLLLRKKWHILCIFTYPTFSRSILSSNDFGKIFNTEYKQTNSTALLGCKSKSTLGLYGDSVTVSD